MIDELLCELRGRGLGARVEGPGGGSSVWTGAAMLTDDLALVAKDDADPRAMFELVLHRARRRRFAIAYKKTHLVRVGSGWERFVASGEDGIDIDWAPGDAHAVAHVRRLLQCERSAVYLGYVLHASLSDAAHIERQLGMVYFIFIFLNRSLT